MTEYSYHNIKFPATGNISKIDTSQTNIFVSNKVKSWSSKFVDNETPI